MLNFPNTPTLGQQYSLGPKSWQWDGVAWVLLTISNLQVERAETAATTALSALVTNSPTPPVNPLPNREWIDSDTGKHYTWLEDVGGFQWVETFASLVVDNVTLVDDLRGELETVGAMPSNGSVTRAKLAGDLEAKLLEIPSVNDRYTSGNHNAAVQAGINAGNITFTPGVYTLLGVEISIPSNRKIVVQKGATLNCTNVRWTAYNVNNVEWQIDGTINALAMATAPAKVGWPSTAAGTQLGDERGFIEFGGSVRSSASVSGFALSGSGKIIGPFVGSPNFSDSVYQVNRKGITVWNCKNVSVEGIDISGFEGEQVYANLNTPDCVNVVFDKVHSHHCRMNALNFNIGVSHFDGDTAGAYRGLRISNCVATDCYAGIEASAGLISNNYVRSSSNYGIWFGVGTGRGPIEVAGNTVEDCAGQSYVLSFSSSLATLIYDTSIHDNKAIASGSDAFAFNKLTVFTAKNNMSRGHGRLAAGKAFAFTNCTQGWVDGNITFDAGAFSSGNLTSVTSILDFGSNPVINVGGTSVTANGNHFGFGGRFAQVTTYGNRENQFQGWSSDFGANGAGAEHVWKNGSGGNVVYATVSGKGDGYDGSGSTGGIVIATKKANTSQVLPTATAEFTPAGDTILSGKLTTTDIYAIRNSGALVNGAGVAAGTLPNCPSAGAPTKWIAIRDGAVDRYVPSWTF